MGDKTERKEPKPASITGFKAQIYSSTKAS